MISECSIGKKRAEIGKVVAEIDEKLYNPRKASKTRFIAHEHNVLCNQFRNWSSQYVYYERRARSTNLKSEEVIDAQNKARDRQCVRTITTLLAMIEITDVLGRASCMLQKSNALPWEHLDVIELLLQRLLYIKECFDHGRIPDHLDPPSDPHEVDEDSEVITEDVSVKKKVKTYKPNALGYQTWDIMKKHLPSSGEFQKTVPVLCKGQIENRTMTRFVNRGREQLTMEEEITSVLKQISAKYINGLIKHVRGYFFTGVNPAGVNTKPPEWMKLAKTAFNFLDSNSYEDMKNAFSLLHPLLIQPMTEVECTKSLFQYSILHKRMSNLATKENEKSLDALLYQFCRDPQLYKDCELATYVMLFNNVISTNECVIESLISRIEEHNSKGRPLSEKQLHYEMMVKENGPHPLHPSTEEFLRSSLH